MGNKASNNSNKSSKIQPIRKSSSQAILHSSNSTSSIFSTSLKSIQFSSILHECNYNSMSNINENIFDNDYFNYFQLNKNIFCVYTNIYNNMLIFIYTNGNDYLYYSVRDINKINNDITNILNINNNNIYSEYINYLNKYISSVTINDENIINLNNIKIQLYPLTNNININIKYILFKLINFKYNKNYLINLLQNDPSILREINPKMDISEELVRKASQLITPNLSVETLLDGKDDETKKWLNEELLSHTYVVKDLNLRRKLKAYSKVIMFTNKINKMYNQDINLFKQNTISNKSISDYLEDKIFNYLQFDVFEFNKICNNAPLYNLGIYLFEYFDLINQLHIPIKVLQNFLHTVELKYLDNPYHNNIHATDVTQTVFSLYMTLFKNENHKLDNLELFTLLVSSICHDLNHPGYTNLFEKKTKSNRSLTYNDRSILENYHCFCLFELLRNDETNIMIQFNQNQLDYFREIAIDLILATDISQHIITIGQIRNNELLKKDIFTLDRKDMVVALLKVLLKCADVSNPTKSYSIYYQWIERVMTEFYRQGDKELELGLNISPFMDRRTPNVPKCQTGFIEYIVNPIFKLLFEFNQEETLFIQNQLNDNLERMIGLVKNNDLEVSKFV
ncbi:hypothetical protein ABK040_006263 [Willaertia magna]